MTIGKHLLGLTAVLLILSWFAIQPQTFYSNDIGLRYKQMRQFIEQDWQTAAIPYPNESYDPMFEHVPYYYGYSLADEEIYFSISTFFPLLLSFGYQALGLPGLLLPTILPALMTAYAIYRLAKLSELKRPFLWFWVSILGTPIIFYAIQIWDHSLATGFTTLGIALTAVSLKEESKRSAFQGALLIGLALAQRPETYLFAVAAGAALLLICFPNWAKFGTFVVGGLAGSLITWIYNWFWIGHPFGFPLANQVGYGVPDSFPVSPYTELVITPAIKIGRLLLHINARDPLTFTAALLLLISIILFFFGLRVPAYQKTAVLWAGFGCVVGAFLIWSLESTEQAIAGLLSTSPLLPLSVAFAQNDKQDARYDVYRFVFFTAVFHILIMLIIWPSFGGEQWGARYLLHAYPLLLFSAAFAIDHYQLVLERPLGQVFSRISFGLIAVSILFQLMGVRFLYSELYGKQPVREEVAALEADIVYTNHPFLPSFMSSLEDKQFFFVDNESDLIKLINIAYNNGVRDIAVLPLESGQLQLPSQIEGITIQSSSDATYQLLP